MNLAILHYHLNRGGVTRVIGNQLAALDAVLEGEPPWRAALLYGGRQTGWSKKLPGNLQNVRLALHEVPALDYDDHSGSPEVGRQLAATLRQIGCTPDQTVLHVHNHALGKNVALPAALGRLAAEGFGLLLQIHDFPEDFRPDNYRQLQGLLADRAPEQRSYADLGAILYPQAPQVHYAVLNGRDQQILRSAGAATERLHRLPNPVPEMDHLPPAPEARRRLAEEFGVGRDQRLILYPVRCIRRKNIGEALLYAALAPPDTVIGLTLPPLSPAEVSVYESWVRLATELELPCRFGLGVSGALSLAENLAAADLICTTSVAEGFGMVFLESWLAGRPLIGRDLPEITRDFTELGLRLDWLRPELRVPVDWVGTNTFCRTMLEAYRRTLEVYGRQEPRDLPARLGARIQDGLVDFADLDEPLQQQVLRIVSGGGEHGRRVLQCNAWLQQSLSIRRDGAFELIEANARAVRQRFSAVASGRRLLDVYRQVAASPRSGGSEPLPQVERILEAFLDFARFRPVRG